MAIKAVYPGTFDPLTRGHEDLVRRAAALFGNLVVGIADSRLKRPFFSADERVQMAREVLSAYPGVTVLSFSGLLRDFVLSQKARVIVRGLRAVSDFEYEFQMAGMNRNLIPDVETVFLTPTKTTSSSPRRSCGRSRCSAATPRSSSTRSSTSACAPR
jgi:pantetheine-phosphate adenylyltransferase